MTDVVRKGDGREAEYPTSDGKPLAETDLHRDIAIYVIEALKEHFAHGRKAYVSGNNFLYFVEGDPTRCVSPDAYVVLDIPMYPRHCYKAWEEGGKLPDVVFEFTSKKTRREDTDRKRPLYERQLHVPEYFLFDPQGHYLKPRLQGFRLTGGEYVPLELVNGRLHSERLGLDLVQDGDCLRLWDSAKEAWLLSPAERSIARAAAEAENARLRAEIETLRRQLGKHGSEE